MIPVRLIGIAAAFLIAATAYSVVVPVLEAPDEPPHYLFIRHLLEGRGLPVLAADGKDNYAGQEGAQPPLYYLTAAAFSFWTDPSDFETWQLTNWHQNVDRYRPGNKNLIVHTNRESFPYTGSILGIHVARLVSVLFGLVTVVTTFFAAKKIGLTEQLALAAAAIVAFNPQFIFLSGTVNGDNAGIAAAALAFFASINVIVDGPSKPRLLFLGFCVGLAMLGKLSGIAVAPLSLLAVWLVSREAPAGMLARRMLLVVLPAAAVAGWWYLRNLLLYGDPLGWSRMLLDLDSIIRRRIDAGDLLDEARALSESMWAVFGWRNIPVDPWIYWTINAFLLAAAAGLVWRLIRPPEESTGGPARSAILFCVAWIAVYGASLIRWVLQVEHTGQGRLLFPALPAIAILLTAGLGTLFASRRALAPAAFALALGGLAVVSPWRYILPAYPQPRLLATDEASEGTPLKARFGETAELVSYRFEPRQVTKGQDSWLVLGWRAIQETREDLDVNLRVLGKGYRPLYEEALYPALGSYPFPLWRTGQLIEDRRLIRLPVDVEAPDFIRIELSLRPRERSDSPLEVRGSQGEQAGTTVAVSGLSVRAPGAWPPGDTKQLRAQIAANQTLEAFRLENYGTVSGDRALGVTLYWTGSGIAEHREVVLKLVDSAGSPVAESRHEPVEGWAPTNTWQLGDQIEDEHELRLPERLSGRDLQVRLNVLSNGNPLLPEDLLVVTVPAN